MSSLNLSPSHEAPRARIVVVNADDFGLSAGVSSAIIRAHRDGIVTSTSLMVRPDAAPAAVAMARSHPELGIGLHVDLGEWALRDGEWKPVYAVVDLEHADAVRAEILHQLDGFRALVGSEPTHIDSHQHVHRSEPVRAIAREIAQKLDVPLRHAPGGAQYHGDFYGQDSEGRSHLEWITPVALAGLVERLGDGIHEIACHPGSRDDPALGPTMYRAERAVELASLCDPLVRLALERGGFALRSFRDMGFAVVA